MPKRCAIVGAGPIGITSARWALGYGITPVVFELTDKIGGLWVYKSEETQLSSVMRSTVINTSKEMSAFSDFPPPASAPPFMHNVQMRKYFESYAKQFGVVDHIRYNHLVVSVDRHADYDENGTWTVKYQDNNGHLHEEVFDYVLLCCGHHAHPNWPKPWPGQEHFKGRIIHSHSYKNHSGFEDQVTVGVGIGNSGADVVCELSRVASQVYLSTRRGAWVYPKLGDYGQPIDMALNSRFNYYLKKILPSSLVSWYSKQELMRRFDHNAFGLQPAHDIFAQHPTMSDELPGRIFSGTVVVKPDIKRFTETGIEWMDGTLTEPVHNVVLSTGYKFSFPLLEGGTLVPVQDNRCMLYKFMWPVNLKFTTLAIMGLIQPVGAIFPSSEMQARLFFHVATGGVKLPDSRAMVEECNEKRRAMAQRYVNSQRHTIQVDFIDYMEELGSLIDCVPNPLHYILTDPLLAYRLIFNANVAYCYRLRGPHAWHGARDAIVYANERLAKATRTRDPGFEDGPSLIGTYIVALLFIALILYWIF